MVSSLEELWLENVESFGLSDPHAMHVGQVVHQVVRQLKLLWFHLFQNLWFSLVEEQPKVEKPAEKTSPFTLTPKSKSSPPSLLVEEKENESFKLDRKLQIPGLNILPNEFVNPNAEKPKQRIF